MRPIRTFVAVEMPGEVSGQLARLIRRLEAIEADVKWVEPSHVHLTLNFLGDVRAEEIHEVCRAAISAAASLAPFEVLVKGLGAFPDLRRPRTIWAGIEHGAEELCELQQALEDALYELGYPRERRKFHPHVTLGRVRGHRGLDQLSAALAEHTELEFGLADIDEAVVFSSELRREGPVYATLGSAPLTG